MTYAAYGAGEKPKLYGWDRDLADPDLWLPYGDSGEIWKLRDPIPDCGTLVFGHGSLHSRKLIPSYMGGRFVCRDDESVPFVPEEQMTRDLDMVCFCTERLTEGPFPIPLIDEDSRGVLLLKCRSGNPGAVFSGIEALARRPMFRLGQANGVRIDGLCIKYVGGHAIAGYGPDVRGLTVTNCEIGWIGGTVQDYCGTDPNYPQGKRGQVTRYGNGVELYGGCTDYTVSGCLIYQVYDAGITHQNTTDGKPCFMRNITYSGNLIEYCTYGIEYFLNRTRPDRSSRMENCLITGNIIRMAGFGWGKQRHNTNTPALIKGWEFDNAASGFCITNNILDRSSVRLIHLAARERSSLPFMSGNVYIQPLGGTLGKYGAKEEADPVDIPFDKEVGTAIRDILADEKADVQIL